jgi:hypothetical protein
VYLRNIFPEDCFKDGDLCGVSVKGLDPDAPDETARKLSLCLEEGVLACMDKQCLASVEVLISATPTGPVAERYALAVSDGGLSILGEAEKCKPDPTKSVRTMLRKLLVTTDALGELDEGSFISLRLHYKANVPEEFEPRWFQAGGSELQFQEDGTHPLDLHLGKVETETHQLAFTFQARPEQIKDGEDDEDDEDQDNEDDEDENGYYYESETKRHRS